MFTLRVVAGRPGKESSSIHGDAATSLSSATECVAKSHLAVKGFRWDSEVGVEHGFLCRAEVGVDAAGGGGDFPEGFAFPEKS